MLQQRIQEAAKHSLVNQLVVERDYAQSYVLSRHFGPGPSPQTLVFKGGTALKKIYFEGYRFSEVLDFSAWARQQDKLSSWPSAPRWRPHRRLLACSRPLR